MGQDNSNRRINPHISIDCVLFGYDGEELKVLLVQQVNRQGGQPAERMKLPGSLIYDDEDLDEAVRRVLYELTGLKNINMGDPMVQTVIMGVINILFTVVAILTVEKWGRKPLLITGSIGMGIGAAGVALTNLFDLPPIVSVVSIMVLLKNQNHILPLSKQIKTIAIVGPNAADSTMLWANYNGFPTHTVTILEGIQNKIGSAKVIYEQGCEHDSQHNLPSSHPHDDWSFPTR